MSPEQARGKPLDKRTDIWSFGCVVYEILTACRAFPGDTLSATLAGILEREPAWEALPPAAPPSVGRLLRRCLHKYSTQRLRDIGDARLELEEPTAPVVAAGPETPRHRPTSRRGALAALLGLALAAAAAFGFLTGTRTAPANSSPVVARLQRLTDLAGLEEFPAMSPDGRSVAFTASVGGEQQIFVRLMAGGPPLPVTSTAGDHERPRWTPDSSSIVYFSPPTSGGVLGSLWSVSALRGAPRRITESLGGADVNEDGRLAFFRLIDERVELVTWSTDGSDREVVGRFAPGSYHWSPGGARIAFQQGDGVRFDIYVVPAGGRTYPGHPRQPADGWPGLGPAWSSDGRWLFCTETSNVVPKKIPADGGRPSR